MHPFLQAPRNRGALRALQEIPAEDACNASFNLFDGDGCKCRNGLPEGVGDLRVLRIKLRCLDKRGVSAGVVLTQAQIRCHVDEPRKNKGESNQAGTQ